MKLEMLERLEQVAGFVTWLRPGGGGTRGVLRDLQQ